MRFVNIVCAIVFIIASGLLFSCGTAGSKKDKADDRRTIMIFAAASLTDVLSEIVDSFEVNYPIEVKTNVASSGTLARQIEQGGGADVYLSANKKWADYVDSLGYMQKGYKSDIAKNKLVLIAPLNSTLKELTVDSSLNLQAMLGTGRLSVGDLAHVPAGRYAKKALGYFGWYKQLEGRILPAKDVRSALMVVEMEEAPLGIVYRTDAQKSEKVKILGAFPEKSHEPVVYVGGVCSDNKAARDFFAYLKGGETKAIWLKYGFEK